jgi:hypothetical protein
MTTDCPALSGTATSDCRVPFASSLHASCAPVHVPLRTYNTVSNAEPSVSIW